MRLAQSGIRHRQDCWNDGLTAVRSRCRRSARVGNVPAISRARQSAPGVQNAQIWPPSVLVIPNPTPAHIESSLLFAVKRLSWGSFEAGASEAVGGSPSGPSSRPGMAVASPHLQVVRPRFAAGAPSGPAASPAARWQRPGNAQPCPGCRPRPWCGGGAREWLVRRAGVRGASRPPWMQSGSPVALPGPLNRRPAGRRRPARRRWRR
jgi:hypothetical protein